MTTGEKKVFKNISKAELVEHALANKEGVLSSTGALICDTGKYTGRSPHDKFTVCDQITESTVWFSNINKKMSPDSADKLYEKISAYILNKTYYVSDVYAGASARHRVPIRVYTERAWHALFVANMFIHENNIDIDPEFTVYHAPSFKADPIVYQTNSEACVCIDFAHKRIIICGTEYAGEIKKSVFTVLNYLYPKKKILGMHCSANKNSQEESALFFGLSGTGKTTLSAETSRSLIGDDEHGWDESGIFNFEGGCYAKVINLLPQDEPEIYHASRQFSTILENVVYDQKNREVDLFDSSKTENTRASYDLGFIPNACISKKGAHPKHIIMLTCDAFGVLPPIARLSPESATYHFISGYTAKVAGTERGIKEPQAVFSPCFGAPFMAHFPHVYAMLLYEKICAHDVQCWLVNTGWTGGAYGQGNRFKISWTRTLLHAALDNKLKNNSFRKNKLFNLEVPTRVEDIPDDILMPEKTWKNQDSYFSQAQELVSLFAKNIANFTSKLPDKIIKAGPEIGAKNG